MSWSGLLQKNRSFNHIGSTQPILDSSLAVLIGLLVGLLLVYSWGLSSSWQGLILVIPAGLVLVMLINDIEKLILTVMAVSVPLNLDISLIISPYARNPYNLAHGHRTIIGITELRLSLVAVLLVAGYAFWIIRSNKSPQKPVQFFAPISIPALGLIFFFILSTFRAGDIQLAMFRVVQFIELFLAYFYLANHVQTTQDFKFFLNISMGAMLAESILMNVQWVTNLEFIIAGVEAVTLGPGRVAGTMGNTGPAAGYMSSHALLTFAMALAATNKSQKIFALITLTSGLIALIGTGSRISWGAFGFVMIIFVTIGLWRGWIKFETLILLITVGLFIGSLFFNTIYARYTEDDGGSAEDRGRMNRLALQIIQANFWFGVGPGNYPLTTKDYYNSSIGHPEGVIDIQVHNAYLGIWGEGGTFALMGYVSVLGAALYKAFSCIRSTDIWISIMGTAVGCAILVVCIGMLTGNFVYRPIMLWVWLLLALAAGINSIQQTYLLHQPSEVASKNVFRPELNFKLDR